MHKSWIFFSLLLAVSCTTAPDPLAKITFDLSTIRDTGLTGPPGGLRSVAYEFCIPAREDCVERVKSIDPSVQIHRQSPGRIGCTKDQYLCIGETHQEHFRDVLRQLAELDYVQRIDQCFFE